MLFKALKRLYKTTSELVATLPAPSLLKSLVGAAIPSNLDIHPRLEGRTLTEASHPTQPLPFSPHFLTDEEIADIHLDIERAMNIKILYTVYNSDIVEPMMLYTIDKELLPKRLYRCSLRGLSLDLMTRYYTGLPDNVYRGEVYRAKVGVSRLRLWLDT